MMPAGCRQRMRRWGLGWAWLRWCFGCGIAGGGAWYGLYGDCKSRVVERWEFSGRRRGWWYRGEKADTEDKGASLKVRCKEDVL
ncbi:hypothetical protein BDZ45DRAFT_434361 [Acephala macrosclerotiorum]|nr:hypothetical protein BDZ45DRAFT_434361 [Acephala macrosclerotiorum]